MKLNIICRDVLKKVVGAIMLMILLSGSSSAVTEIDQCQTINDPGEYLLISSIINSTESNCINITTSNVVFDGNNNDIDGKGKEDTYGVYVHNSTMTLFNVTVKNLEVKKWGEGFYYDNVTYGTIVDVNVSYNDNTGIQLMSSSNINVTGNTLTENGGQGIHLINSNNNNLNDNIVSWSFSNGIVLVNSINNNIIGNIISGNDANGIVLADSSNNNLTENTIRGHIMINGISLGFSNNCNVKRNIVLNNGNGIDLISSSNNNLVYNNVSNNEGIGFSLYSSSDNDISSNIVSNNHYAGIALEDSFNNDIFNNYFDNEFWGNINAIDNGNNNWNTTKQAELNIIGGSYLGGNYWSDYTGFDTDGDGLGDTLIPYNNSGNITVGGDYLPLIIYSPQQLINNLIDKICELDEDVLNQGQEKALIKKLQIAQKKLDEGNNKAAINLLQSFINHVNCLIRINVLAPEEGDALIEKANEIMEALQQNVTKVEQIV